MISAWVSNEHFTVVNIIVKSEGLYAFFCWYCLAGDSFLQDCITRAKVHRFRFWRLSFQWKKAQQCVHFLFKWSFWRKIFAKIILVEGCSIVSFKPLIPPVLCCGCSLFCCSCLYALQWCIFTLAFCFSHGLVDLFVDKRQWVEWIPGGDGMIPEPLLCGMSFDLIYIVKT